MRKKFLTVMLSLLMGTMTMLGAVIDKTSFVSTDNTSWGGNYVGWAAPSVTTADGRTSAMVESYENVATVTPGTKLHQTISGLTNGTYTVVLYANDCYANKVDGGISESSDTIAYVFATSGNSTYKTSVTSEVADSKSTNGEYTIDNVVVTDGTLTLGLATSATGTNWHSIQIKSLTQTTSTDYETLTSELGNANALLDSTMSSAAKATLNSAITTAQSITESSESSAISSALTQLEAAMETAETSIASYNVILGDTKAESSLDNWTRDANGAQFVVNTWSDQGKTDGSNMTTPFVQEWTGSAYTLDDGNIYYTLNGVDPGIYSASVLVRVMSEAGKDIEGKVNVSLNDGTAVEVVANATDGTYTNTNTNVVEKCKYATVTVVGVVGDDGVLKLTTTLAGANYNWIAFKNLSFTQGCTLSDQSVPNVTGDAANVTINRTIYSGYNTLALPFATTAEALGVKAYTITGGTSSSINAEEVTELEANKPYIVYASADIQGLTLSNVTLVEATPGEATAGNWTFNANYTPNFDMTGMYGVVDNQVKLGITGATLDGLRGYFTYNGTNAKGAVINFGDATGIDGVKLDANGNLVVDIYNVNGQLVQSNANAATATQNLPKGIYIMGGKKVVVK